MGTVWIWMSLIGFYSEPHLARPFPLYLCGTGRDSRCLLSCGSRWALAACAGLFQASLTRQQTLI